MEGEESGLQVGLITSPFINMNETMPSTQTLNADQLREQFLQCHVCFEDYNEDDKHPRLLPCLHTFCFLCVNKMKKDGSVECPTCRIQHKVRTEDLREFPKDNTRRDLMDFVQVKRHSTQINCQSCCDNTMATYRCKQCAEFLCDGCRDAHKKTTVTRGHELIPFDELKSKQNLEAFSHPQKCMSHQDNKLELYCSKAECLKPICVSCALTTHKESQGHKIENADDVCIERRGQIVKQMESLQKTGTTVSGVITDVDKETNAVGDKGREVENEIDVAFDNLVKVIEKRRSDLKEEVSSHVTSKTKVLDTQMNSLKFHKTRIDEAMNFSNQALSYTNASAFLQIEKTICRRLQNLIHQSFDKVPHETAAIGFTCKGLMSDIQKAVVNSAHVWGSSVYPPKTMIERDGEAVQNEIVTFFAMLYNYQDQKIDDGIGNLTAVVKGQKGSELGARVDDRHSGAEGRFRVTFVPFNTGPHVLEIRIMGRPVGCVKFDVQPRIEIGESKIPQAILQKAKLTEFVLDRARAHRDVTVSPDGKTFLNSAPTSGHTTSSKDALQKYKGAMTNTPLTAPGSHYYEFNVRYKIRRPLEKCNLVFEIGLARKDAIDSRHHVEGQQYAWSLIGAHHNECDAICLHIAHGNQCIYHDTLSMNESGATINRTFGFLVDTDKKEWKIFNCHDGEQVCVIDGVDATDPLYPVVAGYNPYQVEVTMNLRAGKALPKE